MIGNRQRALQRAVDHAGLVVVESPPGFEADRFLEQLTIRSGSPAELLDPDDVDGNAVAPSAILRAPLHAGLRGWRDTVVRRSEENKPTVIVLPPGISGDVLTDEPVSTLLIDAAALRLTVPDIVELGAASCGEDVIDAGIAEFLAQLSDGWPTWLRACLDLIADRGLSVEQLVADVGVPTFRRRIVGRTLRSFSATDHLRLAQLAHFAQFSDNAAKALGGADFAFSVLPMAPGLYRMPSGQLRFVEPVRLELIADAPLEPESAEILAPVLVSEGQLLGACHALLDAGMSVEAATMIEHLPGTVIDMADQRELLGVLRVLGSEVESHPGLALQQARVHSNLAEIASSVEACELAIEATSDDDPVRLEASIELLLHRHRMISQEEAVDMLADLRGEVGSNGPLSTRLRQIEADILGQSPDPHVVVLAADRFVEVASEWEYQQEYLRAAKSLRGLAMGPLLHLGRYREGQERLERASRLAIGQAFDYGVTLVIKAMFDARCRDFEALERSRGPAGLAVADSGLRWLEAHLYLADAFVAVEQGSASAVRSAIRTARELLGPQYASDGGVFLAAEGARLLAEVGDHADARRTLEWVSDRSDQNPVEYGLANVVLLARAGDRKAAWSAWRTLDALDIVPNDRRWRAEAELARCDLLAGERSDIDVASIEKDLHRLGLNGLLEKLCPELDQRRSEDAFVQLLGGFRVTRGGHDVEMPDGHVSVMLKLIGVSGGSANVDFVIHHLWPDADRSLGLRRLKNVVKKARQHLGEELIIRTPDAVAVPDRVRFDLAEFEMLQARAIATVSTDPVTSRAAAIGAVDLFRGPLLPDDVFNDFITDRRFELGQRVVSLLDMVDQHFGPSAAWLADARQRIKAD